MENDVMVYFVNGRKAAFNRDMIAFKDRDGTYFTLSEKFEGEDEYNKLIQDGRAFINWDNVCYVQEIKVGGKTAE